MKTLICIFSLALSLTTFAQKFAAPPLVKYSIISDTTVVSGVKAIDYAIEFVRDSTFIEFYVDTDVLNDTFHPDFAGKWSSSGISLTGITVLFVRTTRGVTSFLFVRNQYLDHTDGYTLYINGKCVNEKDRGKTIKQRYWMLSKFQKKEAIDKYQSMIDSGKALFNSDKLFEK